MSGRGAELRITLISGFRALPTRESSEEVVRLLREKNRIDDVDIRLTTKIDSLRTETPGLLLTRRRRASRVRPERV